MVVGRQTRTERKLERLRATPQREVVQPTLTPDQQILQRRVEEQQGFIQNLDSDISIQQTLIEGGKQELSELQTQFNTLSEGEQREQKNDFISTRNQLRQQIDTANENLILLQKAKRDAEMGFAPDQVRLMMERREARKQEPRFVEVTRQIGQPKTPEQIRQAKTGMMPRRLEGQRAVQVGRVRVGEKVERDESKLVVPTQLGTVELTPVIEKIELPKPEPTLLERFAEKAPEFMKASGRRQRARERKLLEKRDAGIELTPAEKNVLISAGLLEREPTDTTSITTEFLKFTNLITKRVVPFLPEKVSVPIFIGRGGKLKVPIKEPLTKPLPKEIEKIGIETLDILIKTAIFSPFMTTAVASKSAKAKVDTAKKTGTKADRKKALKKVIEELSKESEQRGNKIVFLSKEQLRTKRLEQVRQALLAIAKEQNPARRQEMLKTAETVFRRSFGDDEAVRLFTEVASQEFSTPASRFPVPEGKIAPLQVARVPTTQLGQSRFLRIDIAVDTPTKLKGIKTTVSLSKILDDISKIRADKIIKDATKTRVDIKVDSLIKQRTDVALVVSQLLKQQQDTLQTQNTIQKEIQKSLQQTKQLQKTSQLTRQVSAQATAQLLRPQLQTKQITRMIPRIKVPKIRLKPPKIPLIILPPIRTTIPTPRRKSKQSYNVFAKPHRQKVLGEKIKGFKQLNKVPLTKNQALSLGAYAVDTSLSRKFKIQKAKGKPRKPQTFFPKGYFNQIQNKLRTYKIRGGKRIPLTNTWIEKDSFLLDTKPEINQITLLNRLKTIRKKKRGRRTPNPFTFTVPKINMKGLLKTPKIR